jgi:hypothetical protein
VKQTRDNIDSHDWDARASEALANAKKLPPGSKRTEAIRKAGQLRVAADMKSWLMVKEPAA